MKCHSYWLLAILCCFLINYSEQYGVQGKSVESESSENDNGFRLTPKWNNLNKIKWLNGDPTQNDESSCGYKVR